MKRECYISIVIITFNKLAYLKAVVANLMFQTVKENVEIIIVNDGSTDGTEKFLADLSLPYPTKMLNTKNEGSAVARNLGVANTKGNFILFMDNDILLEPDYLEKLVIRTAAAPDRIHSGNIRLIPIDIASNVIERICSDDEIGVAELSKLSYTDAIFGVLPVAYQNNPDADLACWWGLVTGGNICFPRIVFDSIGGFDETFTSWGPEDVDLTYRAFKKGYKLAYHHDMLLFHLDHERNSVDVKEAMARNVSLLLKKYNKSKDIIAYINFFNGMLSLNAFNLVCNQESNGYRDIVLDEYYVSLDYYINKEQMINWKKNDNY